MNRVLKTGVIFLLLAALCQAGNDPNGNELSGEVIDLSNNGDPKNLHYESDIAYREGKMSLQDLRVDNYPVSTGTFAPDGEECVKLGSDRVRSDYSESVDAILCKYDDKSYLEAFQEYGGCTNRLTSTRDREYELEITNATGEILLSCPFTFTIETQCFDCESGESGNRGLCDSEDRFDFSLALPYHEDAKKLRIYEIEDDKRKTVLSASVSKFKDAPEKFSDSG
ncbi:MAG TPA: hypothetical protein P5080_01240 [Candidatus Paceibacterota bacterium]|nr:hypothetical protein [Candidatus Pacearchaeota archaeon]HRZ50597.1 hypothetical protein [Candidatus Paceibacterota bacterium]HSA36318.1 hypothetical protein [Candidatus Paceibacterota bacterium]